MRAGPVPVTGALGSVGSRVVTQLVERGEPVVALVRAASHDRRLKKLPSGVAIAFADLTDESAVREQIRRHQPRCILHLAAAIPPHAYSDPDVTVGANVTATANVVAAAQSLPDPCRLVHASSMGVHGSRNPHSMSVVTAQTAVTPCDIYGVTKAASETLVRESGLPWLILRIGTVVSPEMAFASDADKLFLSGILPADARVHVVDVRDVARAFVHAVDATCSSEILLVAGDDSCRRRHEDVVRSIAGAVGLHGAIPSLAVGDPGNDDAWYIGDWMDTARAQAALDYQRVDWTGVLAEVRRGAGFKRHLLPLAAPLVRRSLARAYQRSGFRAPYAQPWPGIVSRWGTAAVSEDSRFRSPS